MFQSGPAYVFNGLVDDASVFNRPLSASEVGALAAAGTVVAGPTVAKGVTVNLAAGTATGATGGVARFQVLQGSAFADILIGDGGDVFGQGGDDLLFAGPLSTRLSGDAGDDLLIGGTTSLDPTSLDAVLATWVDTRTDAATRLAKLRAGLLGPSNVAANGKGQALYGGAGVDGFLTSPGDTTDVESGEPSVNL